MSKKISKSHIHANALAFVNHGRQEITDNFKNETEKYKTGSLIAYETIDGRYTKGGFITKFDPEYVIWITFDFDKKYKIRYHNIKRMWIGDVFQVDGDYVAFKKPDNITNYEAKIGIYPVRYFKNQRTLDIFLASNKYQHMLQWYDMFKDLYM